MINYNWDCKTVDVKPTEGDLTNVVYNVHWKLNASEGDVTKTAIGTESVSLNEEEDASFVSFEDLTNEVVSGWVQAALGEEEVASLKASLAAQIDEENTPTSVTMVIED
tara:strand:- start:115 stop:441 length:327 start_codon:yes stop_codon:yes gene_type:complete